MAHGEVRHASDGYMAERKAAGKAQRAAKRAQRAANSQQPAAAPSPSQPASQPAARQKAKRKAAFQVNTGRSTSIRRFKRFTRLRQPPSSTARAVDFFAEDICQEFQAQATAAAAEAVAAERLEIAGLMAK